MLPCLLKQWGQTRNTYYEIHNYAQFACDLYAIVITDILYNLINIGSTKIVEGGLVKYLTRL